MTDLTLDSSLKMTNKSDLIAKITGNRVADIRIGEIHGLVPKANADELKMLKKAIKNKKGLDSEEHHNEIGAAILIIIYRLFQDEETRKIEEWDNE